MNQHERAWAPLDPAGTVFVRQYSFGAQGTATAFATRLADGRLVVLSPPCHAAPADFDDLARHGDVAALVVTNGFHHLGQAEWRARFPNARSFAAPEAAARVKKKNPGAGDFEPMSALQPLLGPNVSVTEAPTTRCGETWARVTVDGGNIFFVSDMLANIQELPKNLLFRALFKWTGSGPGYRPFNIALKFIVKDKKRVLRELLADMEAHPPTVVVPAHGDILTGPDVADRTFALLRATIA